MDFLIVLLKYTPYKEPPPLPINWTYTGIGFLLAIVAIIWMSLSQNSKNEYAGCFPGILIIGAGVLLFPLITWICLAINSLIGIGFILFIVGGVLFWIFQAIKK